MLWCAVVMAAGFAIGLNYPLPYYLPLLVASIIACTLLRKSRHWHEVLTLVVWLLLGCSRAALCPVDEAKPASSSALGQKAIAVQTTLAGRLQEAGLSPRTLALSKALVLGQKDGLRRETRQAYANVGASHLLAMSGMHLGIIYMVLYFLFIHWVRFGQWRWFALPPILLLLWGYVWMTGIPVTLMRAALMLTILTIMLFMQYNTDPLHPLALSAIIILLIKPTELLSISFQLSFAAVFFIVALWRPLSDKFPSLHWTIRLLGVSCVATLGTMPITLYYFHQLPLLGPLLSIILIPMTTVIIWLALAVMLMPIEPFAWLLNHAEALQQKIIELAGSIPGVLLTDIYLDKTVVALMYGAMIIAIIRLRTREPA